MRAASVSIRQLGCCRKKLAAAAAPEIDAELAEVTGGAVTGVNQIARLQAWLQTQGCAVESLDKKVGCHSAQDRSAAQGAARA